MKLGETNHVTWGLSAKMTAYPRSSSRSRGRTHARRGRCHQWPDLPCLQATMNTRLHQPSITVRLHKESPRSFEGRQAGLPGTGHPSF
jgi:hypothetical protein